jgi:peptide/nickel transport system substrate-binding protein
MFRFRAPSVQRRVLGDGKRRGTVTTATVVLLSAAVAGCGAVQGSSSASSGHRSTKSILISTASAAGAGNLRVVLPSAPEGLDPLASARTGEYVWGTMIEPLVAVGANTEPTTTGLATSFKQVKPTDWHFTVRTGVTFTNGEAFNASAAAYIINQSKTNAASILKGYFGNITSVKVDSPTSFDVITAKPQLDIPDLFSSMYVVPPKYYGKEGTKGFANHPIGTGPFEWQSQNPGASIRVTANPNYWGAKPKVKTITFTWATDASERLSLLESGAADVAVDLPPQQATQAHSSGLNVTSLASQIKITLFLAANQPPLKGDLNLRKAIAMAINRKQIVSAIFQGKEKVDSSLLDIQPGVTGGNAIGYDPSEAKKLAAGSPTLEVSYPVGQGTDSSQVAQAIVGELQAAGINAKLNPLSYTTLDTMEFAHTLQGAYLSTAIANISNPDWFAEGFLTSTSISQNCPDSRFDSQVLKALTTASQKAADQIYDTLDNEAVDEDACFVPLYDEIFNLATSKKVTGLVYTPLNVIDYNSVGLS